MRELERFVAQQLRPLVPDYDRINLTAVVDSFSYSVEFFVTLGEKKMQCFEMVDSGMLSEKKLDSATKAIAEYIRGLPDFLTDSINKYSLTLMGEFE